MANVLRKIINQIEQAIPQPHHSQNLSKKVKLMRKGLDVYWRFLLKTYYKLCLLFVFLTASVISACFFVPEYNVSFEFNKELHFEKNFKDHQHNILILEKINQNLQNIESAATDFRIGYKEILKNIVTLQENVKVIRKISGFLYKEVAVEWISKFLQIYNADKLGLRDYALKYVGGIIVSTPKTTPRLSQQAYIILEFFSYKPYSNPEEIILPNVQPGQCFAFEGNNGKIIIKLANEIHINAITLEHAPLSLLSKRDALSSPKNFSIFGYNEKNVNNPILLGNYQYKINGPPIQTFLVINSNFSISYSFVKLEILSNHGNPNYTCVYRFRVHGLEVNSDT